MDEPPAKRTKLSASPSNDNSEITWSSILSDFNSKLPDELGSIQIDETSFLNPNGAVESLVQQDASVPKNDHLSQLLSAAAAAPAASSLSAAGATSSVVGSRLTCLASPTTMVGNLQALQIQPTVQMQVSMGQLAQMPVGLAAIGKNIASSSGAGLNAAVCNSVGNMISVPRLNAMTLVRPNRPSILSQTHTLGVVGPSSSIVPTSTGSVSNTLTWPVSVNMTSVSLTPTSMIIAVDQGPQLVTLQRSGIPTRFPQKIVRVSAPLSNGPSVQPNIVSTICTSGPVGMVPNGSGLLHQTAVALQGTAPPVQVTMSQPQATGTADPEKRRLIQQQLVLLLHAHKCQRREQANGAPIQPCQLPHCQTMKNVLNHMSDCHKGKLCKVPHCASSRQIITHWKNCTRNDCPVCLPLKNASERRGTSTSSAQPPKAPAAAAVLPTNVAAASMSQPFVDMERAYRALGLSPPNQQQQQILMARQSSAVTALGGPSSSAASTVSAGTSQLWSTSSQGLDGVTGRDLVAKPPGSAALLAGMKTERVLMGGIGPSITGLEVPNHPVKEWHQSVTKDLRNHLVEKLVQAIFPTPDPLAIKDKRINNLVQYARKVEGDMYETANSREEYYHLLAEKIYKIQKELEEKRFRRMKEHGGTLSSVPIGSGNLVMTTAVRLPIQNGPVSGVTLAGQQVAAGSSSSLGSDQSSVSAITLGSIVVGLSTAGLNQQLPINTVEQKVVLSHQPIGVLPAAMAAVVSTSSTSLQVPVQQQQQQQQQQQPLFIQQTTGIAQQTIQNIFNSPMPNAASAAVLLSSPSGSMMLHVPTTSQHSDDMEVGMVSDLQDQPPSINLATSSGIQLFNFKEEPKTESSLDERQTNASTEFKFESGLDDTSTSEVKLEQENSSMILDGMKSDVDQGSSASVSSQPPKPINKKTWKPNELRQVLMPILEKLYRLEPESLPFRQAVDPVLLQIPDYFDIIKKPMDLSMIKRKLDTGQYTDPWQYVDDVWLMFDNAWLYNRKTSKVHKFCTKLSEVFELEIDNVMHSLGFCCGRKFVFCPQVLCCYGKPMCTIAVHATYYSYQNRYVYCEKCFLEVQGNEIELVDDPSSHISKDLFQKTKNSDLELEQFVECTYCGRKQHQVCSLHMEQIWPNEFICAACATANNVKRRENKYTAKRLPQTKLGTYLENRVNSFLKKKDAGAGEVTIRVLASSEKIVEVKPGMKTRYNEAMADSFPYIAKAIFAFEEIDGADVCFFGMHVQEYGSNSLAPNSRRIYLAYLDSVNFFQPKHIRTSVYHEILIGYLDYVKNLGYTMAHIWACPPSEGDDYIFHCHPPDMKIPKPKRLQEWYKKMLDKAIIERVVIDYKDVLKDAIESNMQSVTEMPYFEGDFWPNVLEESIKELDQEEEDKRKREEVEAATTVETEEAMPEGDEMGETGKKKGQKGNTATKKKNSKSKSATQRKSGKKCSQPPMGNDLAAKLFAAMEKHKEVFFVIRLHSTQAVTSLPAIKDPDPFVTNDLMDGRDAFLMLAREKHYEFSSLRRAKFSTMAMLYELHTQGKDNFVYTCNSCKANIETHYHCNTCDDFDLCVSCYLKDGHPHKMEKLGLDLDEGSVSEEQQQNPQEARRLSIQRCIQSLVHACQCRDANCRLLSCQKMKRVMAHTKLCKRKTNGGCPVCKQLIALCCYHAKHCQEAKCPVPFCLAIKQKLHQQQLQQRLQQAHMMRRRMAAMQRGMQVSVPVQMAASFAPAAVVPSSSSSVLSDAGLSVGVKTGLESSLPEKPMMPASVVGHKPETLSLPQPSITNVSGINATTNVSTSAAADPVPLRHGHGILMTALQQPRFAAPVQQVVSVTDQQQTDWKASFGVQLATNANSNLVIASQPLTTAVTVPLVVATSSSLSSGTVVAAGTSAANPVGQLPVNANHQVALQKLLVTLRSPSSQQQRQQVLNILKTNPQLMAAFFKRPPFGQRPTTAAATTQSLPISIQLAPDNSQPTALVSAPTPLLQSIAVSGNRVTGISQQQQQQQQPLMQQLKLQAGTPGGQLQARIISSIGHQLIDANRGSNLIAPAQSRTIVPHYSGGQQVPQGMIIVQQTPSQQQQFQLQIKQQLIGSSAPLNTSLPSSATASAMVATGNLQESNAVAQVVALQAAAAAAQSANAVTSTPAIRSPHLVPSPRQMAQLPSPRLTLASSHLSASVNARQMRPVRPTITIPNHGLCQGVRPMGADLQNKANPNDQVLLSPLQTTFQPNLDLAGLGGSLVSDGSITPLTPQDQLSRYVEQL